MCHMGKRGASQAKGARLVAKINRRAKSVLIQVPANGRDGFKDPIAAAEAMEVISSATRAVKIHFCTTIAPGEASNFALILRMNETGEISLHEKYNKP